ncbi:MAG: DUF3040 domain-containing protein [Actinomycetota bacterium]|nr:DUF3040 domain-containing protein [Actinomycetota bacterium]MDQ2883049.1 DUF3040 domain-containing protein [Actinomycetota bacterium]PZS11799.1 MAG: hypothetical protein DLM60_23645 [Pseudonocardiales bacterium]
MLSDRDREALDEIQHQLLVEDPNFGRSFEVGAHRLARQRWYRRRRAYTIAMVVLAMLSVLMLVLGSPTNALVLAAMAALLWERRRRPGSTTPQKT